MQMESDQTEPKRPLRQNKLLRIIALIAGALALCCCGVIAYAAYETSTPEYKATATGRAIVEAAQEADLATSTALAEGAEEASLATESAQTTAVAAKTATSAAAGEATQAVMLATEVAQETVAASESATVNAAAMATRAADQATSTAIAKETEAVVSATEAVQATILAAEAATAAANAEATQSVVSATESAGATATAVELATVHADQTATQAVIEATEAAQETATEAARPTETPLPTSTSPPTATSPPVLKVEILSAKDYVTRDQLVIYGEVINSGAFPAEEPDVRAVLYAEDGSILAVEDSFIQLPLSVSFWFTGVLYPGEKAPFRLFIDEPGDWSKWELDLTYNQAPARDYDEHYRDLRVVNDAGREISSFLYNYRVSGEVENIGSRTCGPVRFVVTLYDAEGNVVGLESYMEDVDPFRAGDSYPFAIDIYARGPVATYSIMTRAIRQ